LVVVQPALKAEVGHGRELVVGFLHGVAHEHVTELRTAAILDSNCVNIGKVKEEVVSMKVFRIYVKNLHDLVGSFLSLESVLDVLKMISDCLRAQVA